MWYCVHALLYFRYVDGNQADYTVWEHLYLVAASSPREAHEKGISERQKINQKTLK